MLFPEDSNLVAFSGERSVLVEQCSITYQYLFKAT